LPGARAHVKNQEPELSSKFRSTAGAMAITEVALALGPFLNTDGFAKRTENWTYSI